jgi:hypothetical protein
MFFEKKYFLFSKKSFQNKNNFLVVFSHEVRDISIDFVITKSLVEHDKVNDHGEKYQHESDSNPKSLLASFAFFFSHPVCLLYVNKKFKNELRF